MQIAALFLFRPYEPPRHQPIKESARFQEQTQDTPQFRGYTNPNIQSHSFKTLQSVIDSGQGMTSDFIFFLLVVYYLFSL